MKNGTVYANRIKKAFTKLGKATMAAEPSADPVDPMEQLVLSILGSAEGDEIGRTAVDVLKKRFLDWNKARVSTPDELASVLKSRISDPLGQCHRLRQALYGVFQAENIMSLDRTRQMKIREAKSYLEALPGVDEYVTASVMLWSLDAHAIPVCDRVLEVLRAEEWVEPQASRAEVQAFLERHIKASEAKRFCSVMNAYAAAEVKKRRTTRTRRVASPAQKSAAPSRKTKKKSTKTKNKAGARR